MTRVRHVEVVFIFIVPGAEPEFQCLRISRHLISGYLSATSSAYHRPQCTLSRVGASTRPGPPPRGASAVSSANARTFLLPAPGNHASSFFLNLHTPTCRADDIYFESQVIPFKGVKHLSGLSIYSYPISDNYTNLCCRLHPSQLPPSSHHLWACLLTRFTTSRCCASDSLLNVMAQHNVSGYGNLTYLDYRSPFSHDPFKYLYFYSRASHFHSLTYLTKL
jgi:hypothetical protein